MEKRVNYLLGQLGHHQEILAEREIVFDAIVGKQTKPLVDIKHAERYLKIVKLQRMIDRYFDLNEVQRLAVAVGVDFENLKGDTKVSKADALVSWADRNGRLDDLVVELRRERPFVGWLN